MGDDEDGWIKWGVKSQGRIGRGEARLKGDVEDCTGPQARSYAEGVTLHRPHLPICHVHSRLLDGIRARRHLGPRTTNQLRPTTWVLPGQAGRNASAIMI